MSSKNIPSTSTDTDNNFSLLDSRIQYERVLVPPDGSEMSDRPLRHASSRISLTIRIILGSNAKKILDSPSYGTRIFLYAVLVRGKAILFGLYILLWLQLRNDRKTGGDR